jgi:hypothetical protein
VEKGLNDFAVKSLFPLETLFVVEPSNLARFDAIFLELYFFRELNFKFLFLLLPQEYFKKLFFFSIFGYLLSSIFNLFE